MPNTATTARRPQASRREPPTGLMFGAGLCLTALSCTGSGPGAAARPDPPTVQVTANPTTESPGQNPQAAAARSCTLKTSAWRALGHDDLGSPLRTATSRQPFAYISAGTASVKLTAGTAADSIPITFASGGVELRGVMTASDLPLHPRRPIVFEGFAIPLATAHLLWRGDAPDGVRVTHSLKGGMDADKLQATVPCQALSLQVASFSGSAQLLTKGHGRLARLRFDRKSPLATSASGAVVAWIDPEAIDDDDEPNSDWVRELAFDGTHSQIVWERSRDVVFGWTPADTIYILEDDEADELPGDDGGIMGLLSVAEVPSQSGLRVCRSDLVLFASVLGDSPVDVGTLKAGVGFQPIEEHPQMTALVVPDVLDETGAFIIGEDAQILADNAVLAECREIP